MNNFFKKITGTALTLIIILTAGVPLIANAETTPVAPPTVNDLFRPFNYQSGASNEKDASKIAIVAGIAGATKGTWQEILASVIKFVLAITGALAFASFTYAGILMVSARGNEEQIKKGKDILMWSIIALAIIATSYALVLGVSQLRFGAV